MDRVLNILNYDTVFKFFSMTFKSKLFHFHDWNPNWQPHVFLERFHFYIINFCRTLFSFYCFWIVHMRLCDCCSHPAIHLFILWRFYVYPQNHAIFHFIAYLTFFFYKIFELKCILLWSLCEFFNSMARNFHGSFLQQLWIVNAHMSAHHLHPFSCTFWVKMHDYMRTNIFT